MPRLAGVTAALNQGLQVGYNEAQGGLCLAAAPMFLFS